MTEMGLFEAIYSSRALRRFRPDPIPEEVLTKILDAAIRAPSAGNAQSWSFVVVRDAELRQRLGAIYRKASDTVSAFYAARGRPAHMSENQYGRLMSAGAYLWDHMGDAPVLLLPCGKPQGLPPAATLPNETREKLEAAIACRPRIEAASIYPAVQNIILACRALGLATVITTNHMLYEDEVRQLLEIPGDVNTYALMPIGYPIDKFGPVVRKPLNEVARADRWTNPWPAKAS
jgi:nitroreductase